LALGSACFGTIGLFFDGLYTRRGIDMQGLTMAMITLFGIMAAGYLFFYILKPDKTPKTEKFFGLSAYGKNKKAVALIGVATLLVVIIFLIQPTFNHTYVAYTGTLKRLSILMSVVMGHLFFNEGDFKKRIWAAILIIAGAILISTDDLPVKISSQIEGWGL